MPEYRGRFVGWMVKEAEEKKFYHDACATMMSTEAREGREPLTTLDLENSSFICDKCGEAIVEEEEE